MKSKSGAILSVLAFCGGAFGASINGSQFVNKDWSSNDYLISQTTIDGSTTNNIEMARTTGTGGTAPVISGGELTLTMVGATAGSTRVSTGVLDPYQFHVATNYVVTTRMKVTFADNNFSATTGSAGIDFFDIRGMDRAWLHLEADGLWVNHANNDWEKIATVTTAEDTYYTWQFEINNQNEAATAGAVGTMDIYRRASDSDPWTTVATGVTIRNQNVANQFNFYLIYYNADNTQTQGVIVSDYLQVGTAIPAPAKISLIAISAMVLPPYVHFSK
jgi:hypothetical protein